MTDTWPYVDHSFNNYRERSRQGAGGGGECDDGEGDGGVALQDLIARRRPIKPTELALEHLCDLTLSVKQHEHDKPEVMMACSALLATGSRVLAARLHGHVGQEVHLLDKPRATRILHITGHSPEQFRKVLNFLQGEELTFAPSEAPELYHIADFYEIRDIAGKCEQFWFEQLSSANCCSMLRLAKSLNCDALRNRCFDFLILRFEEVCLRDNNFCNLDAETIRYVTGLDSLVCSSEHFVFDALMIWYQADPVERHAAIVEMLAGTVRWERTHTADCTLWLKKKRPFSTMSKSPPFYEYFSATTTTAPTQILSLRGRFIKHVEKDYKLLAPRLQAESSLVDFALQRWESLSVDEKALYAKDWELDKAACEAPFLRDIHVQKVIASVKQRGLRALSFMCGFGSPDGEIDWRIRELECAVLDGFSSVSPAVFVYLGRFEDFERKHRPVLAHDPHDPCAFVMNTNPRQYDYGVLRMYKGLPRCSQKCIFDLRISSEQLEAQWKTRPESSHPMRKDAGFSVGRGSHSNVQVVHKYVSVTHCTVKPTLKWLLGPLDLKDAPPPPGVMHCATDRESAAILVPYIWDHSVNGTYVNGLRVTHDSPLPLTHNDRVDIHQPFGLPMAQPTPAHKRASFRFVGSCDTKFNNSCSDTLFLWKPWHEMVSQSNGCMN
jgi:hypothetical protein